MREAPTPPFHELLTSLQLKAGEDLDDILALAWAAQRYREHAAAAGTKAAKKKAVKKKAAKTKAAPEPGTDVRLSRASCLYAVLELNPVVREQLVAAGMKPEEYRWAVSLSDFEAAAKPDAMPREVVPNPGLRDALARYAERYPDRHRFDGAALAYGCLATTTGQFVKAVEQAGLDLERGRRAMAAVIEGGATPPAAPAGGAVPPDLEAARPAIAVLVAGESRAMAFLVGPRHAVTAAHVVSGFDRVELRFGAAGTRAVAGVEADVVVLDEGYDYALLALTGSAPSEVSPLPLAPRAEPGARWLSLFATSDDGVFTSTAGTVSAVRIAEERPILGLTIDDPGPQHAPGASGAPLLVDGAAVGIFGYGMPDGSFGAIPAAALLSDARVREHLDPAGMPPEPAAWVTVAGTESQLDEVSGALAAAVGERIAAVGLGLTTGGGPGVDHAVARAYGDRRVLEQRPAPMRVVDLGREGPALFGRGRVVQAGDWVSGSLQDADLVVLFDGGGSVRTLAAAALDAGVPVLPLPVAGTTARGIHHDVGQRWEERPVPGLDRDTFERLAQADADDTLAIVDRALGALAGGMEQAQQQAVAQGAVAAVMVRPEDAYLQVANDAVGGVDRLNLESRARTFARVMVARSLHPPLAIGLFGPWGSGKSYFMDLMERYTREFAAKDSEHSWQRVCQIRFNAWHYMDSDLWATLAGRIFDGMAEYLAESESGGRRRDAVLEKRRRLRARLRSSFEARAEAERSHELARATLARKRQEYETARREVDQKVNRLSSWLQPALWEVLKEQSASLPAPPEAALASARAVAKRLGLRLGDGATDEQLRKILAVPEEAAAFAEEVRSTHAQLRSLAATLKPEGTAGWVLGWLVVLTPIVAQILLDLTGRSLSVTGVTTVLGQVALLVAPRLKAVREQIGHVSTLAAYANSVRERGEETRRLALERIETGRQGEDARAAKGAFERADSALRDITARLEEIEQTIADARSELDALDSGKAVYEFVLEKGAEGGQYRAREGVVSMVRRDLETLSELLKQWNDDAPSLPEVPDRQLSDEERAKLGVQRIILYIDDLDRCPRERVVDVLQAVHLLLAFDLFVVVVGVDPRWLERSLESTYEYLIGDATPGPSRFHHPAATAQDYLEKIFQIPFTLPAVEKTGFENLVADHLKLRSELEEARRREAAPPTPPPDTAPTREPGTGEARAAATGAPPETPGGEAAVAVGAAGGGDASKAAGEGAAQGATPVPPSGGEPAPPEGAQGAVEGDDAGAPAGGAAGADLSAEAQAVRGYYVEAWERRFLNELSDLLHTPRAIKRFVNVYRLIRVGVSRDEYAAFAADRPDAHYRVVAVLLAVNVGFPRPAARMLRGLAWPERLPASARFTDFPDFVKRLDPTADDALLTALAFDARERRQLAAIHRLLAPFAASLPADMATWSRWAEEVGRYSMYWRAR